MCGLLRTNNFSLPLHYSMSAGYPRWWLAPVQCRNIKSHITDHEEGSAFTELSAFTTISVLILVPLSTLSIAIVFVPSLLDWPVYWTQIKFSPRLNRIFNDIAQWWSYNWVLVNFCRYWAKVRAVGGYFLCWSTFTLIVCTRAYAVFTKYVKTPNWLKWNRHIDHNIKTTIVFLFFFLLCMSCLNAKSNS